MPVLLFLAAASWLCGAQEYRSSDRDKAQVLDFLKRVLNAVDQDAFLEPERLRSVLGIEVLEWAGDENVSPFHRNARRIVTNVSVLDDTDIANRLRYSIVPREGRYVFWIDRMAHVTCVSPREVVAALGEPNVLYGHTHGRTDDGYGVGYSFKSTFYRSKVAAFYYATPGDLTCLDAVYALPVPLKRQKSPGG